jgi:imidazolonepropionase
VKTLLIGAQQIVTCRGPARARHGQEMADLEVLDGAGHAVLVEDGVIASVGSAKDLRAAHPDAVIDEITGVLFPGFVDAHTHAVFGAARLEDHERRARGKGYKEIAAAGGGILSSVRDVRERAGQDLERLTAARLQHLLRNGTTTVEVKSGYGLALDAELKQLDVIRRLQQGSPRLIPTFLGAHEVPLEYRDRPNEYVKLVVDEMLPTVVRRELARYCDVFCEPGVFTPQQSRVVLEAARRLGLGLKLHADELDASGGAELAVELGAVSADHLAAVSEGGIEALSRSATIAVLLPGTMLFLGRSGHAPARRLIDSGAAVALATDFNPGSSPGMSLPLMAMMGVSQLRMLPAEAVVAITVNGAAAIGEAHRVGQIATGFAADFALAAVTDWRELPYWYGANLVSRAWVSGAPCPSRLTPLDSSV